MEVKTTQPPPDLEVLFVVKKSKNNYFSRDKVRQALDNEKAFSIASQMGLSIMGIQKDECTANMCENDKGHCEDTVFMDEGTVISVTTSSTSFVSPSYHQKPVCMCKDGYAGDRCQIIVNECAKEPCPTYKECIPDASQKGYSCQCPSGLAGQLCNVNITDCKGQGNRQCRVINPMTFGGQSYVSYTVKRSIERHLSLSVGMRSLYPSGTIMYAAGNIDYSILEFHDGKLRYRFNFGSGEGIVTISNADINIIDGKWHNINLERHGNSARLKVDNTYEAQGAAPGINDVLNLEGGTGKYVYFGAEFSKIMDSKINKGFTGCIDDIRLDGIALPLHAKAKSSIAKLETLNNVDFGCDSLSPPGICGSYPCLNSGRCVESADGGYRCQCASRFRGLHCEHDTNPCISNPCLHGGTCINDNKGGFQCLCPSNLSGTRCHYGVYCNPNPCQNGGMCEEGSSSPICKCRGYTGHFCTIDINECKNQNPCGNGGTCINTKGDFRCLCPEKVAGKYCTMTGEAKEPSAYILKLEELVGMIVSLFGIVIFVSICIVCRNCSKAKKRKPQQTSFNTSQLDVSGRETLLNSDYTRRQNREDNGEPRLISNYELTTMDQRPLIPYSATRPMSYTPIQNETGYTDTVRSYGSAADELESLPPVRTINPNSNHHFQANNVTEYVPNFQQPNYRKPTATVAPSVCNVPVEGHLDQRILEYYNNKHRSHKQPLGGACNYPRAAPHFPGVPHPPNLPGHVTDSPGLKDGNSLSSLPTSCAADDTQKYFWDSFDLNGDSAAATGAEATNIQHSAIGGIMSSNGQEPMGGLLPKPGFSSIGNSSFVSSSESNENNLNIHVNALATSVPIDITRDIETLPENGTIHKPKGKKEGNTDADDDSDDEPQFGSVFPSNVGGNQGNHSTSFEQLLASNDDINFADDDDEEIVGNGECPNSYDYHLHLDNYLPEHNISEASETDEQTPMLSRHPPPNITHNIIKSPNANRVNPPSAVGPSYVLSSNLKNMDEESDLNRSIAALPEIDNASVTDHPNFFHHVPSKLSGINLPMAPPSLSSDGHSNSNGINRPTHLTTDNTTGVCSSNGNHQDLDNLCELEDSDCETPTVTEMKTLPLPAAQSSSSSSTPRVTRV